MQTNKVRIVLGSAGRRLYLIEWFRDALELLGLEGEVIVAEADPNSPSYSAGDGAWHLPRYDSRHYSPTLGRLVRDYRPAIYISLNDYEIQRISDDPGLRTLFAENGVTFPGVSPSWQDACADKMALEAELSKLGIRTPTTVLGDDTEGIRELMAHSNVVVVKHRFGSASSGFSITNQAGVEMAIRNAANDAPTAGGQVSARKAVVVQEHIEGAEYGVDVVASLAKPGEFCASLARRKMRMRAGETDRATTVDSTPFEATARIIAKAASVKGLVDTDIIRTSAGENVVIDINPRFGGGYPFMHLAGANVPAVYLASVLGLPLSGDWTTYRIGVSSAKFEGVRVTDAGVPE